MLSCLSGLTSDSTTNGIPGSGSTGSTSGGSVTKMHECDARIKKWTKQQVKIMKQFEHAEDNAKNSWKLIFAAKAFPYK